MQKILIIDDSSTIIMSLSRVLRGGGYDVETAVNGVDGMAKLSGGAHPAAIITDLNMPQMDGIAFIKAARGLSTLRFIPILVMTTEAAAGKRDEARAAGASGWLTKPTEPDTLLAALAQILPKT